MFDNNYQTNVLMLDNPTLYINNVRWGGIIVHMFGIRGVDIHSQLRMIFIIATHQLNTYTINPKPSSIVHISSSHYPVPTPTVLLLSYRPLTVHPLPPPLISHSIISPNIHPYTTLYIPKNTHHTQYMSILKASFLS